MKTLRKTLSILLVVAMLLAFASCNSTPEQQGGTTQSTIKVEKEVRQGWHLQGIPSYEGGRLSVHTYNAGPGMMTDVKGATEEDSVMQLAYRTNPEEFEAYLQKLKDPLRRKALYCS